MKILNLIHVFGNKWIKLHHIINIEQIRTIFGIILKPLSLQQAMSRNRSFARKICIFISHCTFSNIIMFCKSLIDFSGM